MNGIFPDYIGPTVEARYTSLYPDWMGDGLFEVEVEVPAQGGGGSKSKSKGDWKGTAVGRRLLREDEEILAVLMVAARTLQ